MPKRRRRELTPEPNARIGRKLFSFNEDVNTPNTNSSFSASFVQSTNGIESLRAKNFVTAKSILYSIDDTPSNQTFHGLENFHKRNLITDEENHDYDLSPKVSHINCSYPNDSKDWDKVDIDVSPTRVMKVRRHEKRHYVQSEDNRERLKADFSPLHNPLLRD